MPNIVKFTFLVFNIFYIPINIFKLYSETIKLLGNSLILLVLLHFINYIMLIKINGEKVSFKLEAWQVSCVLEGEDKLQNFRVLPPE